MQSHSQTVSLQLTAAMQPENGQLTDQNCIAADTHISNRIKIGRNKWHRSSI